MSTTMLNESKSRSAIESGMLADRHGSRVRQTYTELAETFDKWTPSPAFRHTFKHAVLDEINARLANASHLNILEVGCGHGTWASEIFENIAGADDRISYTGIDFTAARIEIGCRRLASHSGVQLIVADSDVFEPRHAPDLILGVEVLSHVPFDRYPAWLSRWRTWLAPGGSAIIIDKDRYTRHNFKLKVDLLKHRFLPAIFGRGPRYYFTEEFSEFVKVLDYPSFRRLSKVASRAGLTPRPIYRHGIFRALTADRNN